MTYFDSRCAIVDSIGCQVINGNDENFYMAVMYLNDLGQLFFTQKKNLFFGVIAILLNLEFQKNKIK